MRLTSSGSLAQVIDIAPYINEKRKERLKKISESSYIQEEEKEPLLSEIADVLVQLTITLDSIGYFKYGNMLSEVVGQMFDEDELNDDDNNNDH